MKAMRQLPSTCLLYFVIACLLFAPLIQAASHPLKGISTVTAGETLINEEKFNIGTRTVNVQLKQEKIPDIYKPDGKFVNYFSGGGECTSGDFNAKYARDSIAANWKAARTLAEAFNKLKNQRHDGGSKFTNMLAALAVFYGKVDQTLGNPKMGIPPAKKVPIAYGFTTEQAAIDAIKNIGNDFLTVSGTLNAKAEKPSLEKVLTILSKDYACIGAPNELLDYYRQSWKETWDKKLSKMQPAKTATTKELSAFDKFAIESLFFEAQYLQNKFNAIEQSKKAAEQQLEEFSTSWVNPPNAFYQKVTGWMSGIKGQIKEIEERSTHQKNELDAVKLLLTEIKDRKKTFAQVYKEAKNPETSDDNAKAKLLKTLFFEPWRYYKINKGTSLAGIEDCFTNPTIELLAEASEKNPALAENTEGKELYYVLSMLSHAKKNEKCAIKEIKQPPITQYPELSSAIELSNKGVLQKQFHENAVSDFQRLKIAYSNPLLNILLSLSEEERDGFILFEKCINSGDERVSTYGAITKYLNDRADLFVKKLTLGLDSDSDWYLSQSTNPIPDCLLKDIEKDDGLKKYANPLPKYKPNTDPTKEDEPVIPFGYESEELLAKTTRSNPLYLYLLNTRSIKEGSDKAQGIATLEEKKTEAKDLTQAIEGLEGVISRLKPKYEFGDSNPDTNKLYLNPGSREWNIKVAAAASEMEKQYIKHYENIFATPSPWLTCATEFVSSSNIAIFGTQALLGAASKPAQAVIQKAGLELTLHAATKVPHLAVSVAAWTGLLLMNGYFAAATIDKYQTTALLWQYSSEDEKAMAACSIFTDAIFFGHGYLHAKLAHEQGLTNKAPYEAIKAYEETQKKPVTDMLGEAPAGKVSTLKRTVWKAEEGKPKPQLTELTYYSDTPGGSAKSGVYKDPQGNFYVVKELHDKNNPNEFLSEVLAARVYRLAGFNVPDMWIDTSAGRLVLISRQIQTEGSRTFSKINPSNEEIAKLYLLSMLLDDRDRLNKNFLINEKEGKYYLVDLGGTFDTSSQGRRKPEFTESFSWEHFADAEGRFMAKNDFFGKLQDMPVKERELLLRKTMQDIESQFAGKTLDEVFGFDDDFSPFGFEKERLDLLKKTFELRIANLKEFLMKSQEGLFGELDAVKLSLSDLREILEKQQRDRGKIDRTIHDLEKIGKFLSGETEFYFIHGTSVRALKKKIAAGKVAGVGGTEVFAWTKPSAPIMTYFGSGIEGKAFILLPARQTLEGRSFLLFKSGSNDNGFVLKSNPKSKSGAFDRAGDAEGIALVNADEKGAVRSPSDTERSSISIKGAIIVIERNANFEGTVKKFYDLTGIDMTKATSEEIEASIKTKIQTIQGEIQQERLQLQRDELFEYEPIITDLLKDFKPSEEILRDYEKTRIALIKELETRLTERNIPEKIKTEALDQLERRWPVLEYSMEFVTTTKVWQMHQEWRMHPERSFGDARRIFWEGERRQLDWRIQTGIGKDIEFLEGFDYKKVMASDDSRTLEKEAQKQGIRLIYTDEAAPYTGGLSQAVENYIGSKGALMDLGLLEQYGLVEFSQEAYFSNGGVKNAPYYRLSIGAKERPAAVDKIKSFTDELKRFRDKKNN